LNWLFEPTVNFYRQTKNIYWLMPADRKGVSPDDDYCYLFKDDLNKLNTGSYRIIAEYSNINTVLIENLKSVNQP
ncbi:MAG TPA: hypothetical protein PLT47_10690, partial [Bacteroidales bacterium]|nr:hypothetical protein [Bacteroidales bacterium]